MGEYSFTDKKDLTNIYNVQEIYNQPERAYSYFMSHKSTVIYVVEGEKLQGIISFGDLERYYKSERAFFSYNESFSFISEKDDVDKSKEIFNKYGSIFEIPVICAGEFIGAVHRETQCERVFQEKRKNLCLCKYFKEDAETMDWKKAFKKLGDANRVIVYNVPTNKEIMEYIPNIEERNNLIKRSEDYTLRLKELTDGEKKLFWESEEWSYSEKLQMESLASIKVIEKNGIKEFENIKTSLYTIENGYRKTLYGRNKSDKRIFLFGLYHL